MIRRISTAVLLAAVAVALFWWASVVHRFFDSAVYSGAVRYWFRDGGMVYDFLEEGTRYGFTYPPFAGFLMAPMAYLPFPAIVAITGLATVVSTVVLTWWRAAATSTCGSASPC